MVQVKIQNNGESAFSPQIKKIKIGIEGYGEKLIEVAFSGLPPVVVSKGDERIIKHRVRASFLNNEHSLDFCYYIFVFEAGIEQSTCFLEGLNIPISLTSKPVRCPILSSGEGGHG